MSTIRPIVKAYLPVARPTSRAPRESDETASAAPYDSGVAVSVSGSKETEAERATRILDGMRRTLGDVQTRVDRLRVESKAQRKATARERIDRVRQQLESLLRFSGDAKFIKREAARLAKELAAAVREYADAGGVGGNAAASVSSPPLTSGPPESRTAVLGDKIAAEEAAEQSASDTAGRMPASAMEASAPDTAGAPTDEVVIDGGGRSSRQENESHSDGSGAGDEAVNEGGQTVGRTAGTPQSQESQAEAHGDLEVLKLVRKLKSILKQLVEADSEEEIDRIRSQALMDPDFDKMISRKQAMKAVVETQANGAPLGAAQNDDLGNEEERNSRKSFEEIDQNHDAIWRNAWSILQDGAVFGDRNIRVGDEPAGATVSAGPDAGADQAQAAPITEA